MREGLRPPGREDEARRAYEACIRQAEKYGHGGMADELGAALVNLSDSACRDCDPGKTQTDMWVIIKKVRNV